MTWPLDISLVISLIALFGVLVNALVAASNARKRGRLDQKMVELKSQLDRVNAFELAKVQAEHGEKLKALEFNRVQLAAAEDRRRSADAANLERILEVLDSAKVIVFLRNHDFHSIYDRDETDPLFRFIELSQRADNDFLNAELEELRVALRSKGEKLARLLAVNTHPRQGTYSSVLPENLVNEERPSWVNRNAEEINECATEFVDAFDKLVRQARRAQGS